jgi:glycosyltransferase involved in cell wall biosynthesis
LLHTKFAANIDAKFERRVLENADAVLVVSNDIKQKFLKRSSLIDESKIIVVPNGYDETDFESATKIDESKFVISYVGTISEIYNPEVFFKVIERVIHSNSNVNFKINFIGSAPSTIKELAIKYNLTSVCDWIPHVEHSKAIDYMKSSNLLLLVIPDDASAKGILTGKLFEYIGSNVPILAIGPVDGDASKIIIECNAGKMFERNEEIELESWIRKQISIYLNVDHPDKSNFELKKKYSRLNLTKKLHDIIFLS